MEHLKQPITQIRKSAEKTAQVQRDLRYILTQKCNYQCSFCHKEWCDGSEKNLLNADDYDFLFSTAKDTLGIQQVTLSGGEPMMRNDISQITKQLHWSGAKVTMVSNGALIANNPEAMKHVDTLNLSLHTTNQDLYTTLTWSPTKIQNLIDGMAQIHKINPHLQIKLNSAIIEEQNTPDTEDFIYKTQLASKYWWKLKYLELSENTLPGFVDLESFRKNLLKNGFALDYKTARQDIYTKDGVEVVTGRVFCSEAKKTSDPQQYCKTNNDIYITPDGYLSSCPVDIKKISAFDAIMARNWWALSKLFQEAVDKKTNYACPFSS